MQTTSSSYGIGERASASTEAGEHAERIRLAGYTIIDAGFDADYVARISAAIDALLRRQADEGGGVARLAEIGEHETARCCLAYDDAFLALVVNPRVTDVCRLLLGDYIVLMQQNAIVNPPGRDHTQTAYHRDLPYQHFVSSRPLGISVLFCVDPFTARNGATVVLPASHRIEEFPSQGTAAALEVPVEAPSGACIVFDSMLFHRAGANRSDAPRRAVNQVYTRPFIAQQISIPDALDGKYADDPALARLLGYGTAPARSVAEWRARRSRRPR